MLSGKAREASYTIFEVFDMTQLRIKPSLPCLERDESLFTEETMPNFYLILRPFRTK